MHSYFNQNEKFGFELDQCGCDLDFELGDFFQILDVLNFSNSSEGGMLLLSDVQKQWSELIFSRQMNSLMS